MSTSPASTERRVFCLSMQRTGTASVGKFFRDTGFRWAGWPTDRENDWSGSWYDGDYDAIFSSEAFRSTNAYEDAPWFMPRFYEVLHRRFPAASFVLFTRDPDAWFRSMLSHSGGSIVGRAKVHCRVYEREAEYRDLVARSILDPDRENRYDSAKSMTLDGHADHYKAVYRRHNRQVAEFFAAHAPAALFSARLEDTDKWLRLADFLDVEVPADYDSHENRTTGA